MELQPGTRIDARYTIGALLGSGGMARVYVAHDDRLDLTVAVKVLTLTSASIRERLITEGKVQASLQHPNVLSVTDIIEVQGSPGLVMPLVRGPALDQLLRNHELDLVEAEHIARGIIHGVQRAHELGLVHRDLKPANVMLQRSGSRLVPMVADFGLAKLLESEESGTRSGVAMGTPRYMAPEQIREARSVDARADLFSLGAILYELFCGRPAFEGPDTLALFNAINEGRWSRPDTLGLTLPERMSQAIEACLAIGREDRVADCAALLELLDGESGPPREAWRPETLDRAAELTSDVTSAPSTHRSSDTWTASLAPDELAEAATGSETLDTFTASSPPAKEASPTPASAAPTSSDTPSEPTSRSPLVPLAIMAVAAVFTLLLIFGLPGGGPQVFTPQGAPSIRDDDVVAGLLDQAWAETRANEDVDAMRHIDEAIERGATDPNVFLLAVVLARGNGDDDRMDDYLALAIERDPEATGPAGELLHTLQDKSQNRADREWVEPLLLEYLAAHPDDHAVRLLYGTVALWTDGNDDAVQAVVDADPEAPLSYIMLASYHQIQRRPETALTVVDEGLERAPNSAALHGYRATSLLNAGREQEAIAAAERALTIDPRWMPALLAGASAALQAGDEEAFARITASLDNPLLDHDSRWQAMRGIGYKLWWTGRTAQARQWWARAEESGRALDAETGLLNQSAMRVEVSREPWLATNEELDADVTELDKRMATFELPPDRRIDARRSSRVAHALLEVRAGTRTEPVEPFEGDDNAHLFVNAQLARALEDKAALREPHDNCRVRQWRGLFLLELGDLDGAIEQLRSVVAQPECQNPPNAAPAHAGLARAYTALGRHDDAQTALAAFRREWPAPDPSTPIVRDLAHEVTPEVLGTGVLNQFLDGHTEPLRVGLHYVEAVGISTSEAEAIDLGLQTLMERQPLIRPVLLDELGETEDVDLVLTGRMSKLGKNLVLRMERRDPQTDEVLGRLLYETEGLDRMTEHLEGALVVLLETSDTEPSTRSIPGTVRRYASTVKECYEGYLTDGGGLDGRILFSWHIEPSGITRNVRVAEDSIGNDELADCIAASIDTWVFPPGIVGDVSYPYVFKKG